MTSVRDALKEVLAAYESDIYEDDYTIVFKNGAAYKMDRGARDTARLDMYIGKVDVFKGVPEAHRVNKHHLPLEIKEAILKKVDLMEWVCKIT